MSPDAQEELTNHAIAILTMVNSEARVGVFTTDEWEVIAHALTFLDAKNDKTDKLLDSIRQKLNIESPYT